MGRHSRRRFLTRLAIAGAAAVVARQGFGDPIADVIERIDPERIRGDLFYLCKSPLPYRKANRTLPGHARSTLDETDEFLQERLRQLGYSPWKEAVKAQAFGFDASKPRRSAYAMPAPGAPWYDLFNPT